jgi:hypothetical protein
MSTARNAVVFILLAAAVILTIRHGAAALRPARPNDMPVDSQFVVSGYDLLHNEPKGDWVACRPDLPEGANFCRVTDAHGSVIFQGDFLTVADSRPVPQARLRIASADLDHMFVRGPAEGGLVPIIPLAGGELLVPAADSTALADRWAKDPDELQRISGQ